MKSFHKITPEGTRDILFEECEALRLVQHTLQSFFEGRGYHEVMTPGLEFYDVFCSNAQYFPQESTYKLTDSKGRLMVMRPDCTIPIARLAATRLGNMPRPIRLYYVQQVYRNEPAMKARSSEVMQMGVELIGASSGRADLEILETAAQSLGRCGIHGFRLEICPVDFFKLLMARLDAPDDVKEEIREYIENKNYAGLSDVMNRLPASPEADALRRLPHLFGGAEVIDEAEGLLDIPEAKQIFNRLRALFGQLRQIGIADQVLLDFGLINQADYYTGLIFRGYAEGIGEPVLSGGRYDTLLADFGLPAPATGFAVNVGLVARAMYDNTGLAPARSPSELLVFAESEDYAADAFHRLDQLNARGLRGEMSVYDTLEESMEYARRAGIPSVLVVSARSHTINLAGGGKA